MGGRGQRKAELKNRGVMTGALRHMFLDIVNAVRPSRFLIR